MLQSRLDSGHWQQSLTCTVIAIRSPQAHDQDWRQWLQGRAPAEAIKLLSSHKQRYKLQVTQQGLEQLQNCPYLQQLRLPTRPQTQAIVNKGVTVAAADRVQDQGTQGSGIKVAVFDFAFQGAERLRGTELPQDYQQINISSAPLDNAPSHGTACAEIVHDLAPGAQLYLVRISDFETGYPQACQWAINNGIDIISSSISFRKMHVLTVSFYQLLNSSSRLQQAYLDQLNYYNQLIKDIEEQTQDCVDAGILFVQAAGNNGRTRWDGDFVDSNYDGWLNFTSWQNYCKVEKYSYISSNPKHLMLFWDDFETTRADYDLYIYDRYGNLLTSSRRNQREFPLGLEVCRIPENSFPPYRVRVYNHNADGSQQLTLVSDDISKFQYSTQYQSVLSNTPAYLPEVLTVGSAAIDSLEEVNPYSAAGPGLDGSDKPELIAPDGVVTASYGDQRFYGTSAAAPHVAGLAALVKQEHPQWQPAELGQSLQQHARDLAEPGFDYLTGYGLSQVEFLLPDPGGLSPAADSNSDWQQSPWLGAYYAATYPWIYHQDYGWLYVEAADRGLWLYSHALETWLWTKPQLFPQVYRADRKRWSRL